MTLLKVRPEAWQYSQIDMDKAVKEAEERGAKKLLEWAWNKDYLPEFTKNKEADVRLMLKLYNEEKEKR